MRPLDELLNGYSVVKIKELLDSAYGYASYFCN